MEMSQPVLIFNEAARNLVLSLRKHMPGDSKKMRSLKGQFRYFDRKSAAYIDDFVREAESLQTDGLPHPAKAPTLKVIAGMTYDEIMRAVGQDEAVRLAINVMYVFGSLYASNASGGIVKDVAATILGQTRSAACDSVFDEEVAEAIAAVRASDAFQDSAGGLREKVEGIVEGGGEAGVSGDQTRNLFAGLASLGLGGGDGTGAGSAGGPAGGMGAAADLLKGLEGSNIFKLASEISSKLDISDLMGMLGGGGGGSGDLFGKIDGLVKERLEGDDIDAGVLTDEANAVMRKLGK